MELRSYLIFGYSSWLRSQLRKMMNCFRFSRNTGDIYLGVDFEKAYN